MRGLREHAWWIATLALVVAALALNANRSRVKVAEAAGSDKIKSVQSDLQSLQRQVDRLQKDVANQSSPEAVARAVTEKVMKDLSERARQQDSPTSKENQKWVWFPEYSEYLYGYWDTSVDPPTFRYSDRSYLERK